MHLRDVRSADTRERLGSAAARMSVRAVPKHDARRDHARERAGVAEFESKAVEKLLSQPLDLLTLESRMAHYIREDLHRGLNFRRHHTDAGKRRVPACSGIERPAKTLDLLRDFRGVTSLCAFREQGGGHVSESGQLRRIDLAAVFDQQLCRDEWRLIALDHDHAQSVRKRLIDGRGKLCGTWRRRRWRGCLRRLRKIRFNAEDAEGRAESRG